MLNVNNNEIRAVLMTYLLNLSIFTYCSGFMIILFDMCVPEELIVTKHFRAKSMMWKLKMQPYFIEISTLNKFFVLKQ